MNHPSLSALAALAVICSSNALAAGSPSPPDEIATAAAKCQTCHDAGSDNSHPKTPRLNGQHYEYLVNQLRSFRDPTRQDPHAIDTMWPVATRTADEMVLALSRYYSSQTPVEPPHRKGALAESGRRIFMEGARNVPACVSCHGAEGQGAGPVPRLAGQHAFYLEHAMESLRFALRESKTMHPELNDIDDEQIKALVAYLAKD